MNRFTGKVVIVTGGASGIGLATAQRVAVEGATVGIIDLHLDASERAAQGIMATGAQTMACAADVGNSVQLAAAIEAIAERFGRLDAIINSAGIIARGSLEKTSEAEWLQVLQTDLSSMFYSARAAAALLRQAGGGAMVNVASIAGSRGGLNVAYVAAKGGVVALTRQLADELAKDGIRVNSVSPGFTATALNHDLRTAGAEKALTGRIPLGRYAAPEEIAAACAFLASSDASYITGVDLIVDGGLCAVLRPDAPQPR